MGYFRFQKRLRFGAKGSTFRRLFRTNISKSGVSESVGRPGIGATFGTSGTRYHVGIPGTGLSYIWGHYRKRPHHALLHLIILAVIIWSVVHFGLLSLL